MLSKIHSPQDIKQLSQKELKQLAQEIRTTILEVTGKNGGHLASNLGVVELTLALHRIFNTPEDAIVWDVSHQCYAHKLLTGRYSRFNTLRKKDGLSGFTNRDESEHDFFTSGHSSTSISAALGLLTAWEIEHKEGKVIAVIGDGALTGGMAFEALSHTGQLCKNLIVVVNDNQMSIDHNTGSLSRYLSRLSMSPRYQSFRYTVDKLIDKIPYIGRVFEKIIFRIKRSLKGLLLTNNLFTDLGFEYVGPLDGHNEQMMEKVFKRVKKLHRPVVVHVVTKKGKGYSPAENNPELFHGIGPFQISDGTVEKYDTLSFTEAFSNLIVDTAARNDKIVGITAAMAKGTGLTRFSYKFPERFFDVGIAEEHAVTFAGEGSEISDKMTCYAGGIAGYYDITEASQKAKFQNLYYYGTITIPNQTEGTKFQKGAIFGTTCSSTNCPVFENCYIQSLYTACDSYDPGAGVTTATNSIATYAYNFNSWVSSNSSVSINGTLTFKSWDIDNNFLKFSGEY